MNLFSKGDFRLHSGIESDWKIDCDALTDEDIKTIAYLFSKVLPPFGPVEGIPRGGLRLAAALREYSKSSDYKTLICDDVYTTGLSMEKRRGDRETMGAVIFARQPTPLWIRPLFITNALIW